MPINSFIRLLHENEKDLANKCKDTKGTDWNAYILGKEKAGYGKFDQWYFIQLEHVRIQLDSKYKYKWRKSITEVQWNDRKIDISFVAIAKTKFKLAKFKSFLCESDIGARFWFHELLKRYEAVGHAISFCAPINALAIADSEMLRILRQEDEEKFEAMTIIWHDHNSLSLILHDDASFI